jgi:hypothetical protein
MFKNFFQYLFVILMVHFILKKFLLDTRRNVENFELHQYQNDENTPSDFNEDYKLDKEQKNEPYSNIEVYESDEESDFDNLKANIINTETDAEESEEEDLLEIENKLRKNAEVNEKKEILGSNGNMDNYREFNFGNDSLNLEHHVKGINTNDFETTFDLNVPTNVKNEKVQSKDEGIMNGGAFMDNIYGFDNLESSYASL